MDYTELQQLVIGSYMIRRDEEAFNILKSEFFNSPFKEIFNYLCKRDTNDLVEIAKETNQPFDFVSEIFDKGITAFNFRYHIEQLITEYKRIELLNKTSDFIQALNTGIPDVLASTLQQDLEGIINVVEGQTGDYISDINMKLWENLNSANDEYDTYRAKFKYGIKKLDDVTFGLQENELTVIGARSGKGKTAFGLQIARRLAKNGLKVLIISREMSDLQILRRMYVSELKGQIPSIKFKTKSFTADERTLIAKTMASFNDLNIIIDEHSDNTHAIRRRIKKDKPDVVMVDYIQILRAIETHPSREREVAAISRELKNLTSDFKIPIIALSQLNDNSGEHRPTGERDMRESKAIYQDANNVIFIHQPNEVELEYWKNQGYTSSDDRLLMEVDLNKQRDGETTMFLMHFIKSYMTFEGAWREN